MRSLGDNVTRIDRMEPEANIFGPGEIRDTTTPTAMLGNLKTLFRGRYPFAHFARPAYGVGPGQRDWQELTQARPAEHMARWR
ncbi:MAG: hypothetical protein WBV18_04400 [Methyloceanibacter sp.]|uniref:hypothetical protein n=1 Tax=Methyloceanibacter sp. TaxID=1965321 RepID=UPI003C349256